MFHGLAHKKTLLSDSYWEVALYYREFSLVLCDKLEGGMGWELGSGREIQEGGVVCMSMPDSCWCMAEIDITL